MKIEFRSDEVEVEETAWGILIISFFTHGHYLTIQHVIDKEDAATDGRMRSHYVERDDQSYSVYQGVKQIELRRASVEFYLNETGKVHLECDSIRASFEAGNEVYARLMEKLRYVFGDALTVCD